MVDYMGLNEQYKVAQSGWLCVKFEAYKWIPVCKLESDQLEKLRAILGLDKDE